MKKTTWVVTELNTRVKVSNNDLMDIVYGGDYKQHEYKTKEEAYECSDRLKEQGIKTNIAKQNKVTMAK